MVIVTGLATQLAKGIKYHSPQLTEVPARLVEQKPVEPDEHHEPDELTEELPKISATQCQLPKRPYHGDGSQAPEQVYSRVLHHRIPFRYR